MGISRVQFLRLMQVLRVVDPLLEEQYRREEAKHHAGVTHATARSQAWHTTFHASSFPLSPSLACARKALYGLMDIPTGEPFSPRIRALMEAGEDIENRVVERFRRAGILLSKTGSSGDQTNFVSKQFWLVGHVDSIILPPGWNSPHPVEVKSTSHERVMRMKRGELSFTEKHRAQLVCYMWFTRQAHDTLYGGSGMTPCEDGTLIYFSRDDPRTTAEFYFTYDEREVMAALKRLWDYKGAFVMGTLPERDPKWRWTEDPCRDCPFKKPCKQDVKDKVTVLEVSNAVTFAQKINPNYSYDDARQRVIDRWS